MQSNKFHFIWFTDFEGITREEAWINSLKREYIQCSYSQTLIGVFQEKEKGLIINVVKSDWYFPYNQTENLMCPSLQ